jgi:hypothetical protein
MTMHVSLEGFLNISVMNNVHSTLYYLIKNSTLDEVIVKFMGRVEFCAVYFKKSKKQTWNKTV